MTVGERAEDVFYITDMDGRLLDRAGLRERCRNRWCQALDRRDSVVAHERI